MNSNIELIRGKQKEGTAIIIISTLVYVKACQELCVRAPKEDRSLVELTYSIRQFSKIFVKYVRESYRENYAVSPLSLHLALGIIMIGSGGSTSAELHKSLGTNNFKHRVVEDYKKLLQKLWTIYSNLQLSQKIWLSSDIIPNAGFVSLLRNDFMNAEIDVFDFSNTQSAAEVINSWSQSFSTGNFTNLTSREKVSRNTSLIISSILNLNGVMTNSLKVDHVEIRKFFVNEKIFIKVPMMHMNGPVIYGLLPEIRASFIKYEIKANELSMIIIRSNEIQDLGKKEQQLDNLNISDILECGSLINMSFFLPKFKMEKILDLKETVEKMGVLQIFNTSANFSGISDGGLKVDAIIQKVSVDINEDGAAVASSTDIRSNRYSKRDTRNATQSFDLNSPFNFVILHERTKLPLIEGRVVNPLSN